MVSLLALAVLAQSLGRPLPELPEEYGIRPRAFRSDGRLNRWLGNSAPFFELAPESGAGLPTVQTLCSQLGDADKAGSWWCLNGDGTMASGSIITLAAQGAVDAGVPTPICPNGPDCAAVAGINVPAAGGAYGYAEPANVDRSASITTGGWTACWHGQANATTAGQRHVLGLAASGPGSIWRFFLLSHESWGAWGAYVSTGACGAGITSLIASAPTVTGAPQVVCLSWAASDGVYRVYVDGAAKGTSSSYTTICGGGTTSRFAAGGAWDGTTLVGSTQGRHFGAFYTDVQLSPARIAQLARGALADVPTGAKGETITFARAAVSTCADSTGAVVTTLPSGRPCVTSGGVGRATTRINYITRGSDLSDAAWGNHNVVVAAPTVTGNYGEAPDNVKTATRLQIPATTAGQHSSRYFIGCNGAGAESASIMVRGASGSGTVALAVDGDSGMQCAVCSYTSTAWAPCKLENVSVTSSPGTLYVGNISDACGSSAYAANDILVTNAQCEDGAYASGYIPTAVSAMTRVAETWTLPAPAGFTTATPWSVAETFKGPTPAVFFPLAATGAGPRIAPALSTLVVGRVTDNSINLDGTAAVAADKWKTAWTRWGVSWVPTSGATGAVTAVVDGVAGTPVSGALTTQALTTMTFDGDGVHRYICFDSNPTRCR